jgi:hypothetical protein
MLIALAIAIVMAARSRLRVGLPLAFSAGVLLFAMTSRINIGSRHVLPVYIGFSIAAGAALARMIRRSSPRWLAGAGIALLAAHVVSGALQHPDYLAYTNVFWWLHPEVVLADSDVDGGQDMKRALRIASRASGSGPSISTRSTAAISRPAIPFRRFVPYRRATRRLAAERLSASRCGNSAAARDGSPGRTRKNASAGRSSSSIEGDASEIISDNLSIPAALSRRLIEAGQNARSGSEKSTEINRCA